MMPRAPTPMGYVPHSPPGSRPTSRTYWSRTVYGPPDEAPDEAPQAPARPARAGGLRVVPGGATDGAGKTPGEAPGEAPGAPLGAVGAPPPAPGPPALESAPTGRGGAFAGGLPAGGLPAGEVVEALGPVADAPKRPRKRK